MNLSEFNWTGGLIGRLDGRLAILVAVLLLSSCSTHPSTKLSDGDAVPPVLDDLHEPQHARTPVLRVSSVRSYIATTGDYRFVDGEVYNLSAETFDNVEVLTTWCDAAGRVIANQEAMIEAPPLRPGSNSPFQTVVRERDDLAAFAISVRAPDGRTLAAKVDQAAVASRAVCQPKR